jgi:methylmalonyl-CoA mutase cobalamin-binding domain/chain
MDELKAIADSLIELNEDQTLHLVERALARGRRSLPIIQACEQAMRVIGERYQRQEYYLSGLILAGEILREVLALAQPSLESELAGQASGTVLLGTVAGDIHDIGKNLMVTALRSFGFTVNDLGVDVPPTRFLQAAVETSPDIVGLSGLITTAFEGMRATTTLLKDGGELTPSPFVILGGGIVDEDVRRFCGADSWTNNAMEGVKICQRFMAEGHDPGGRA